MYRVSRLCIIIAIIRVHLSAGLALLLLTGGGGTALAGGDLIEYGKYLSSECTTCHRIDGADEGIPSITGWPPDDFVGTLEYYRKGQRDSDIMRTVARSLDDEQMEALAQYFSTLETGR
jgi:cytochrome c553